MKTKLLATQSYLLYFGLQHLSDCLKLFSETCTQSTVTTTQSQMHAYLNVSMPHLVVQSVALLKIFPCLKPGDVVANQVLQVQETQLQKLKPGVGHVGSVGHVVSQSRRHFTCTLPYPTTQLSRSFHRCGGSAKDREA